MNNKSHQQFVLFSFLAVLIGLLESLELKAAERPNIILCMADDHGWGDVGYQGHPYAKTPHLDRMANEGIRFDRWYAAAPVCSPTRGSCLTGRHPYRYGIYTANAGHMKADELTLAEVLKQEGYATGHFGKWHLGTLTKTVRDANRGGTEKGLPHYSPPWVNGFDECFSTESKVPTFDPMRNPATVSREAKKNVPLGGSYGTAYWTGPDERVSDDVLQGDDSKLIMDRAAHFIERTSKAKKPFFAVIWFHAPHTPVVADEAHRALYPDHPKALYGQHYHGSISALDDQMGRLRSHLEALGVANNTMLWYCSDNGPESNVNTGAGSAGSFRGRKRSLYEGGVRVPGLLVWPEQVTKPSRNAVPCVTSDYFPTILDALGLELPDRPLDGVSLMPLIRGQALNREQALCFQSKNVATIQRGPYKLVSVRSKEDRLKAEGNELYNLENDPSETTDLAIKHPRVVKELEAKLAAWILSCQKSDRGADY